MIIEEERRIGDLLRTVELPQSNADVARAIASGRRRRRRRGFVAVATATVLVTAVGVGAVTVRHNLTGPPTAPAPAAANCSVTVLPNIPGHFTRAVYGVDPTGRYAVGMSRKLAKPDPGDTPALGWEYQFVRWDGAGEPVGLWPMFTQTPDDGPLAVGTDGTALISSGNSGAALMVGPAGRSVTLLAQASHGMLSNARAMAPTWFTPTGQVGGWVRTVLPTEVWVAFTWSQQEEPRQPGIRPDTFVPVPGFDPLAVGSTGVTVGVRRNPDRYVARHPDGRERDLTLPAGLAPDGVSQVTGDWATGTATGTATGPVQVRWNLTTGVVDRIDGAAGVTPGVSVDGSVAYSDAAGRVVVRAPDGKVRTLPVPAGREVVDRLRISDDGRTVLGALRVPGTTELPEAIEAIRWTC